MNFAALVTFYLLLNAQFIAMVQIIVYAGAIVVLFLFVVMLLGAGGDMPPKSWINWRTALVVGLALIMLTLAGTVVYEGAINGESGAATPAQIAEVGQTEALATVLFTKYVLPFELASVLLLVGMIGAVVLGQRWRGTLSRSKQRE